jgi:hypothetical protein
LGFDRVDGADPVPKYAIPVFFLGEQGSFSGKTAIGRYEIFGVLTEERGNGIDVSLRYKGAAVTPAAVTALSAFEDGFWLICLGRHAGPPALFSK